MTKSPVRSSLQVALGGAVAALLALASQSPALAVECKGMEKLACERNDPCTWVDGYKRKDGVTVASYCRAKGKRKASGSSSSGSSSTGGGTTGSSSGSSAGAKPGSSTN